MLPLLRLGSLKRYATRAESGDEPRTQSRDELGKGSSDAERGAGVRLPSNLRNLEALALASRRLQGAPWTGTSKCWQSGHTNG